VAKTLTSPWFANAILAVPLLPRFAPPSTILSSLGKTSSHSFYSRPSAFICSSFAFAPSVRQFSQSSNAMARSKVFFDLSWEGPVLDQNFRPTGQVKGEQQLPLIHYILIFSRYRLMFNQGLTCCRTNRPYQL
jgi:hypothetical protein